MVLGHLIPGRTRHFHDDVNLILRPESFRILLSCANWAFCYLNSSGITKFKMKGKTEKDTGPRGKMTLLCKWTIGICGNAAF